MKKICFLFLLAGTVMTHKNYSQTFDQNTLKSIKETSYCILFPAISENKFDTSGIYIKRPASITHISKKCSESCKNCKDTVRVTAGFPLNFGSIYSPVEYMYKWKWEQSMKGVLFLHGCP